MFTFQDSFRLMLDDETAARFQQVLSEDEIRKFFRLFQFEGRIGEDDVGLLRRALKIFENVGGNGMDAIQFPCLGSFFYEADAAAVLVDGNDDSGAARGELVADAPRPGEQVDYGERGKVVAVVQDVEQRLLGEIRSGTNRKVRGRLDDSTPQGSTGYSQNDRL